MAEAGLVDGRCQGVVVFLESVRLEEKTSYHVVAMLDLLWPSHGYSCQIQMTCHRSCLPAPHPPLLPAILSRTKLAFATLVNSEYVVGQIGSRVVPMTHLLGHQESWRPPKQKDFP